MVRTCVSQSCQKFTPFFIRSNQLQSIKNVFPFAPSGFTRRKRDMFHLILTALTLNPACTGIKTSIGELSGATKCANVGMSPATVRRALAELEIDGYLSRKKCRLGEDRLGIQIIINFSKFSFWLKKASDKIIPLVTHTYIDAYQSNRLGVDRKMTNSQVNTRDIDINSNHARATISKENASKKFEFLKAHPVLLTLWILLKGTPEIRLFNRASQEVLAEETRSKIENHSGVPWEHYAQNWSDMLQATRDQFARTQILPKLRGTSPAPGCFPGSECVHKIDDCPDESPEQIRRMICESLNIDRDQLQQSIDSQPCEIISGG